MVPMLVSNEFLTNSITPDVVRQAAFFVIARTYGAEDDVTWFEDRTLVTDNPQIAALWALAIAGVVDDDSSCARPLVRINAFAVDPLEQAVDSNGDLPGERVVAYVTEDGDILWAGEAGFADLHETVWELPEIIKARTLDDAT